jgi:flavin-dependent dehydrogenase
MAFTFPVGIVGGGPAGADLARRLAEAQIECVLFEAQPEREKPCGGGLSPRTMAVIPPHIQKNIHGKPVSHFVSSSPSGRQISIELSEPITVVSRKEFDQYLRQAAINAGAKVIHRKVQSIKRREGYFVIDEKEQVSTLAGAGGFNCIVARTFAGLLLPQDLAAAVGYYLNVDHPPRIQLKFEKSFTGYMWFFPGPSVVSAGFAEPAAGFRRYAGEARLKEFIQNIAPDIPVGRQYAWALPSLRAGTFNTRPVAGDGWLLVGDAAGLCDPITGEGIAYAFKSAALAAEAIICGDLNIFTEKLRSEVISNLQRAALLKDRFYLPWFLNWGHYIVQKNKAAGKAFRLFMEGKILYPDLKGYSLFPKVIAEMLYFHRSKKRFRGK